MFRLLDGCSPRLVDIEIDGEPAQVPAGVSVAAALFFLDRVPTRLTPLGRQPRAPFCMIGACFECLLEIDGVANQRGCQVEVRAGMRLQRRLGKDTAATS